MTYSANSNRYTAMRYNRCGNSGVKLPAISLGLWHNFGSVDVFENSRAMLLHAFDAGITHFDLANNYGPIPGSAEETFGQVMQKDLKPYRDEMILSSKAGYTMWDGPYGDWGSRKYLVSSLDQSLKRMGLDYVDILTTTAPTRRLRWKKPCARWISSCAAVAPFTWASPITNRKKPRKRFIYCAKWVLPA
jgi:L-glyceraldehyde 3-phosphate reductase